MNILIVEDDKFMLELLQRIVENLGHTVYGAENSEEAIKKMETQKFDLLLCDIMMPGISGLSLISVLRSVNLDTTPIIMMSTLANKPMLEAAARTGANDFIVKPFSAEEIAEKIKKFENIGV